MDIGWLDHGRTGESDFNEYPLKRRLSALRTRPGKVICTDYIERCFASRSLSSMGLSHTMIFEQSVRREFRQTASSILVVLLAVLLTVTLVRMLDRAVSGAIDPADVLIFLLLSAASSIPQLLVLTAFLAVLLTMTRAFRDQEMAVWFSAGLSLLDWVKPLFRFLMPMLLISLVFAWFVAPWTVSERERFQAQYS